MKKLIIAAFAVVAFSVASYAQVTPTTKKDGAKMHMSKKTTAKPEETTIQSADKLPSPAAHATAVTPTAKKEMQKTGTPSKKDGTPDMRYHANKGIAAHHLKNDGTTDKRFKENKKPS